MNRRTVSGIGRTHSRPAIRLARRSASRWIASLTILVGFAAARPGEAQPSELGLVPEQVIGSVAGPAGTVFGEIVDAVILPDGRIVALDRLFHEVRLFSAEGPHLASSGREGDGPGEFRHFEAVDFDAGLGLSVLDRGAFRLSWYDVAGDSLSFRGSVRVPFQAYTHCTVAGRIYLVGVHEGRMIHEVAPSGEILRSFGEPVDAPAIPEPFAGTVQRHFSTGPLECDEDRRAIFWMMSGTGRISSFDLDGNPRWSRQYPRFMALDSEITERGTHRYTYSEAGWTSGQGLTLLMWLPLYDDSRVTRGYVLEAATGDLRSGPVQGPLLGAAAGARVLGWEQLPFPRLLVFRRGGR